MTNVLYYKYKILIGETGYCIYRNPMHTLCNFSINFNLCAMAPHSSTFAWKIPWTEELDMTERLHFHFMHTLCNFSINFKLC